MQRLSLDAVEAIFQLLPPAPTEPMTFIAGLSGAEVASRLLIQRTTVDLILFRLERSNVIKRGLPIRTGKRGRPQVTYLRVRDQLAPSDFQP